MAVGRRRRHKARALWRVLAICVLVLVMCIVAFFRCRPVATAFAESQAVWLATKAANQTVADILEQKADVARSMIEVSYNDQQILAAVMTDTSAVNTLKTAITQSLIQKLEGMTSITVGIPLGTLIGLDWLSGWGPLISIPMSVTSTVLSDVSSSLEAAGMNQTSYRVLINVQVEMYLVTPGGRSSVAAEFSYPMAQAVLLGDVPENLTEVYGDDQTLLGKIFDYGTGE